MARDRALKRMARRGGLGLLPVYVAAGLIAIVVMYLMADARPAPASDVQWLEVSSESSDR